MVNKSVLIIKKGRVHQFKLWPLIFVIKLRQLTMSSQQNLSIVFFAYREGSDEKETDDTKRTLKLISMKDTNKSFARKAKKTNKQTEHYI